jgi:hypothetical protein
VEPKFYSTTFEKGEARSKNNFSKRLCKNNFSKSCAKTTFQKDCAK